MRTVYCKAEDPKQAMNALAKKLRNKYGAVANVIEEKNTLECGYYTIHFCKEREWEILSTTRTGSGYLTIPYNRLLLSKNGVRPEDCKLNHLIELIIDSCKHVEDFTEVNEEQKKTIEKYKKEAEEYAPAFSARVVSVDTSQVEDQTASVHVPRKVQFNI